MEDQKFYIVKWMDPSEEEESEDYNVVGHDVIPQTLNLNSFEVGKVINVYEFKKPRNHKKPQPSLLKAEIIRITDTRPAAVSMLNTFLKTGTFSPVKRGKIARRPISSSSSSDEETPSENGVKAKKLSKRQKMSPPNDRAEDSQSKTSDDDSDEDCNITDRSKKFQHDAKLKTNLEMARATVKFLDDNNIISSDNEDSSSLADKIKNLEEHNLYLTEQNRKLKKKLAQQKLETEEAMKALDLLEKLKTLTKNVSCDRCKSPSHTGPRPPSIVPLTPPRTQLVPSPRRSPRHNATPQAKRAPAFQLTLSTPATIKSPPAARVTSPVSTAPLATVVKTELAERAAKPSAVQAPAKDAEAPTAAAPVHVHLKFSSTDFNVVPIHEKYPNVFVSKDLLENAVDVAKSASILARQLMEIVFTEHAVSNFTVRKLHQPGVDGILARVKQECAVSGRENNDKWTYNPVTLVQNMGKKRNEVLQQKDRAAKAVAAAVGPVVKAEGQKVPEDSQNSQANSSTGNTEAKPAE